MKIWFWVIFSMTAPVVWSTVILNPTIRDIYVDGTCEESGVMGFLVDGNDFATASPAQPIYLRLRFDHAAVLCETLVWSHASNSGSLSFDPIFLPIWFADHLPGDQIVAPGNTISIARWKKGEPEIWLKIQTSSTSWIEDSGGNLVPPDTSRPVRWIVGLNARDSFANAQPDFLLGEANLPAATRDTSGITEATAVSNKICVDLSDSNLEPIPAPFAQSILHLDPLALGSLPNGGPNSVEEAEDYTHILSGVGVPIALSGQGTVARGFDFNCSGGPTLPVEPTSQIGTAVPGLRQLTNDIRLQAFCALGWGFHRHSVLRLTTPPGADFGFHVATDGGGMPIDYHDVDPSVPPGMYVLLQDALRLTDVPHDPPRAPVDSLFAIPSGDFLASQAQVTYTGPGSDTSLEFSLEAVVSQWELGQTGPVQIAVEAIASNRDSARDSPPFDGADQNLFCGPSLRLAVTYLWDFGSFVQPIPTLGTWAFVLLILLLLAGAWMMSVRRRRYSI